MTPVQTPHKTPSQTSGRKKVILLLLLAAAVALFFILELDQYLTLSYIKSQQEALQSFTRQHTFLTLLAYAGAYIAASALSLPGAAVMTLAGGALFGFWPALVVISFASSIGATLACLVSRYVLRSWVQQRFATPLSRIDSGITTEGPFYLFTLRLVPVFPFFLVNLGMGLTSLPLRTFYWISQLGMLPGTAVYVNAGRELGQLESLSGILSPSLLASFALLGLFPLGARLLAKRLRAKRHAGPASRHL